MHNLGACPAGACISMKFRFLNHLRGVVQGSVELAGLRGRSDGEDHPLPRDLPSIVSRTGACPGTSLSCTETNCGAACSNRRPQVPGGPKSKQDRPIVRCADRARNPCKRLNSCPSRHRRPIHASSWNPIGADFLGHLPCATWGKGRAQAARCCCCPSSPKRGGAERPSSTTNCPLPPRSPSERRYPISLNAPCQLVSRKVVPESYAGQEGAANLWISQLLSYRSVNQYVFILSTFGFYVAQYHKNLEFLETLVCHLFFEHVFLDSVHAFRIDSCKFGRGNRRQVGAESATER